MSAGLGMNDAGAFHNRAHTPQASTDSLPYSGRPGHQRTESSWSNQDGAAMRHGYDSPGQGSPLMPPQRFHDDLSRDQLNLYAYDDKPAYPPRRRKTKKSLIVLIIACIAVIIVAIILAIYFVVVKPKQGRTSTKAGSAAATGPGKSNGTAVSLIVGYDGANVTTETGASFTYRNPFGGRFVADPSDPFNNGAQSQSWVPALNETWTWGVDQIRGVNLGGWLVCEAFIAPALYEKYYPADTSINGDEWTLSIAMANDTAGGGLQTIMENHYNTFITEEDFAQIAGAGLNFVRLPIPFWAINTWDGEPFLASVSWKYALKAFGWARKYGLRVNLDLHTAPGSQNGYNHSGKLGLQAFMGFVYGYANAQRTLDYIRTLTEFITQPEYMSLIPIFGMLNEPTVELPALGPFYLEAYNLIRSITGVGEGKGPYISIHDHTFVLSTWAGFLSGADRLMLDTHPYFAFGGQNSQDITPFLKAACTAFGPGINASMGAFGVTIAGEWSNGFSDCGLYVHGIPDTHTTTNCQPWDDYMNYTAEMKQQLMTFALTQMDALQNWFFWTWKIGVATSTGQISAPLWSYQLGLQQGWMPTDPRTATGACAAQGVAPDPWNGTFPASATGGVGAGTIAADQSATYGLWPPTSLPAFGVATNLPSYTSTAPIITLPGPTITPPATHTVNGWADPKDTASFVSTIAGCDPGFYVSPWNPGAAIPVCHSAPAATVTPPP